MIRFIASSDPRFKTLTFKEGLNVVLADRTAESTDQQSRNGSGKSCLIRLLHFLLGGQARPRSSIFRKPELDNHTFAAGFNLHGDDMSIVRSGHTKGAHLYTDIHTGCLNHSDVPILGGDRPQPQGWKKITLTQWRHLISEKFFGLESDTAKYSLSERSLLSYLMRKQEGGGFQTPFKHFNVQQIVDQQVALSFLLDLDWNIPREWENIRQKEKDLKVKRKEAREGSFGPALGKPAELRTELIIAQDHANQLDEQVSNFEVVTEYTELEKEADTITRELRDLRNDNAIDQDLLRDIAQTQAVEHTPDTDALQRLWNQVNLVLPDEVISTYSEVHEFHESVIKNRRLYLTREAEEARARITARKARSQKLESRRSELMRILDSGGALEHFSALQTEVVRAQTKVQQLEEKYELAETIENRKAELDSRRRELLFRLQGDHRDRSDRLAKAISRFEEYSNILYDERRGSLVIDDTLNGPQFKVEIAGKGSVGIDSMQILCFDLMVTTLLQERGIGPGFLVHDSHIFDGVDERQTASAVILGARLAEEYGFQYLITMNSDSVPEFPEGFDFNQYVNEVKLTDAFEEGGLFGFRFD